MSDLPKDDAPEGAARPELPNTRTEHWVPTTDAGRPGEPADAPDARKAEAAPADAAAGDDGSDASDPDTSNPDLATPPGERIAKAMARAGIASRRDAEVMILEGRVSVNGEVLGSPARNVTEDDRILVDGEPMPSRERSRLWIFHKPRGVVTTAKDPEGRQTVFDILPEELPRVVAVGRLDINTEGLLLLTNDGGLAKVIAHPDTGWLRRYRVRAHGDTDQAQLDRLSKGVTIEGMEYGPVEATLDRVQGDNCWITLGLREGKNREVKRILEHLGLSVNRLIRLSFGPFQLGDLEVGLVEEIRTRVLKDQLGKNLSEQAGVDFESPVREPVPAFGSTKKTERDLSSAQGQGGGRRNAARPAPAPRVSTGGSGSGPRNASWRSDEGSKPRGTHIPRRGADPRASQAAAAERGRERVGAIQAGDRRVLVERLSATPAAPVAEEAPRRRYADRGASDRPQRDFGARPDRDATGGRGFAPRGGGERSGSDRPPREAGRGGFGQNAGRQQDDRRQSDARPNDRRPDDRRQDDRRPDPRWQDDRRSDRPAGRSERSFDGPPSDGAPRGKPGFRAQRPDSAGGKPGFGGGKPGFGGGRPGGGGGKPGFGGGKPGFGGGKPGFGGGISGGEGKPAFGGEKPGGGFRSGAARPGGKPGGSYGGKPGGFGGKGGGPGGRPGGRDGGKPGGSGRPPRGTR